MGRGLRVRCKGYDKMSTTIQDPSDLVPFELNEEVPVGPEIPMEVFDGVEPGAEIVSVRDIQWEDPYDSDRSLSNVNIIWETVR